MGAGFHCTMLHGATELGQLSVGVEGGSCDDIAAKNLGAHMV